MTDMPQRLNEKARRYAQLCVLRVKEYEEDQIAKELGFDSPEKLYRELSRDGFPICTVCGETPAWSTHREHKRRKAKKSTKAVTLPPPKAAGDLFRGSLAKLREDVENLPRYEEHLQGERFVAAYEDPDPVVLVFRRDIYSESEWKRMRRIHEVDPTTESFRIPAPGELDPLGAMQHPIEPLVRLIAAYALSGEDLESLIAALHHDPDSVEESRLKGKIEELKLKAEQLATLVRGGAVRTGPSTGEISKNEQLIAWDISRRREEGISDEEILHEIRFMGYMAFDRPLTKDDVSRLGNLQLEPPPY